MIHRTFSPKTDARRGREARSAGLLTLALPVSTLLALAGLVGLGALPAHAQDAQEAAPAAAADADATDADATPAGREADPLVAAQAVLDLMDAGDFAGVHARFDARMAAGLGVEQLRQVWQSLPAQLGAAKGRGESRSSMRGDTTVVVIPLAFERMTLDASLAFERDGRISGFQLKPSASAPAATTSTSPPVPADANYRERELMIGGEAEGLPATLAMPEGRGPFPAVVLVHGSGPHDRDQTIGPNKPFLDIARGLAERGVAVLRYEKRSRARPQDFADGGNVDLETTDDAVRAAAVLRAQPGIDPKRVYVLGHSLGGMMAPRIGGRDPEIAGLILLAAPSRPLLDLVMEQTRRMAALGDGRIDEREQAEIAKMGARVAAVRRGENVSGDAAPLGLPTAYWRSVEAVDPVAEARAIPQPMLILQGGRDIQVVDSDWQRWKQAFHDDARVSFRLYETLSHLGIPGEGTLQDYGTAGKVAAELIADVAAWVSAKRDAP